MINELNKTLLEEKLRKLQWEKIEGKNALKLGRYSNTGAHKNRLKLDRRRRRILRIPEVTKKICWSTFSFLHQKLWKKTFFDLVLLVAIKFTLKRYIRTNFLKNLSKTTLAVGNEILRILTLRSTCFLTINWVLGPTDESSRFILWNAALCLARLPNSPKLILPQPSEIPRAVRNIVEGAFSVSSSFHVLFDFQQIYEPNQQYSCLLAQILVEWLAINAFSEWTDHSSNFVSRLLAYHQKISEKIKIGKKKKTVSDATPIEEISNVSLT